MMRISLRLTVALLLGVSAASCLGAPSSRDGQPGGGVGVGFSGDVAFDGTIGLPHIRSKKLCQAEKRRNPVNHASQDIQVNPPSVFDAVYYGITIRLAGFDSLENIA